MVFQRPNPFPLSVFDNVVYGARVHGLKERNSEELVKEALEKAWLWEELKDKLKQPALELTLEQQQRLCLSRLLVVKPEILLMDEPCSALDPVATAKIEELLGELKKSYTILIVTHNMQQAARVSDETGLMWLGELVEFNLTEKIFTNPQNKITQDYVTGRAG